MNMLGVEELCSLIIGIVDFIGKVFTFALKLSFAVGYVIINYVILGYAAFTNFLVISITVLEIISEDFVTFVVDICERVGFVLSAITTALTRCCYAILECWDYLATLGLFIYISVTKSMFLIWDNVLNSWQFITSLPEMVKQAFVLVGNEVWLILNNIPLSIACVCSSSLELFVAFLNEILYMFKRLLEQIVAMFYKIFYFGYDIPLESVAGLIAGTIIIFLSVQYWSLILSWIVFAVVYIYRKARLYLVTILLTIVHLAVFTFKNTGLFLNYLWRGTENIILWLVTNQRQNVPTQEAVVEDNASSDDSNEDRNIAEQAVEGAVHLEESTSKLRRLLVEEQENKLCVVCQDRGKCIIIFPCRHLCLCADCCDIIKHQHGACPICRQRVRRTMRVYV